MVQSIQETDNQSTLTAGNRRERDLARFSLRRLLHFSILVARCISRRSSGYSKHIRNLDGCRSGSSRDLERDEGTICPSEGSESNAVMKDDGKTARKVSAVSAFGINTGNSDDVDKAVCPLCLTELPLAYFPELSTCSHRSCYDCFQKYLRTEISESRVNTSCPECPEPMHPCDIRTILNDEVLYEKYEDFMVRRVLSMDPDTRWCPVPDCSFAVIASGCASCPKIKCERPGCNVYFCYHCRTAWHPNQECDVARAQRSTNIRFSSVSCTQESQYRTDVKSCPRCQVPVIKMDDGSCNQMICTVCGAEFCWLCMKEISYLHFISPSGCTFWGKKCWSRKKKIIWQLVTLVGAPVGIALAAGIVVSSVTVGIPVWVGRRLYVRYQHASRQKRSGMVASGVTVSVFLSPFLAVLSAVIAVPILLFYVYGVVPVSLCRFGGCGVLTTAAGVRSNFDDENEFLGVLGTININAVDHREGSPSIGEVSISLGVESHLERLDRENDRKSVTNVALVGARVADSVVYSFLLRGQRPEVQADVASTQRFHMSSETASATTSEECVSDSIDDGCAAPTRASEGKF